MQNIDIFVVTFVVIPTDDELWVHYLAQKINGRLSGSELARGIGSLQFTQFIKENDIDELIFHVARTNIDNVSLLKEIILKYYYHYNACRTIEGFSIAEQTQAAMTHFKVGCDHSSVYHQQYFHYVILIIKYVY